MIVMKFGGTSVENAKAIHRAAAIVPACEGTKITAQSPQSRNLFKAIAVKKGVTIVDVAAPRWLQLSGFLKWICDAFYRHGISIDVVSTSEVSVSVTVDTNEGIAELSAELSRRADVKHEDHRATVCLVAENLRKTPGVAARAFRELENVKIHRISQGASEINLTFVIAEDDVSNVVGRRIAPSFRSWILRCLPELCDWSSKSEPA